MSEKREDHHTPREGAMTPATMADLQRVQRQGPGVCRGCAGRGEPVADPCPHTALTTFPGRLRAAILLRYPSISRARDAMGLRHSTLMSWLADKNTPLDPEDLEVVSGGLAISLDLLMLGDPARSVPPWTCATIPERVARLFDDVDLAGAEFPVSELVDVATASDVSLDWLVRGEGWGVTAARMATLEGAAEAARLLAGRMLERRAEREVCPEVAYHLRAYAAEIRAGEWG